MRHASGNHGAFPREAGSSSPWARGALLVLMALSTMPAAAPTKTLQYGLDYFNITYNSQPLPVVTYTPATYRENPIIIVIPGRSGNGLEFAQENAALAEFLNCIIAVPAFSQIGASPAEAVLGGIYPSSALNSNDSTLLPGSVPNSRSRWTVRIVPEIYKELKTLLNTTVPYILYGDDAGGLFVQAFAAFYYSSLPSSEQPQQMVMGMSSHNTFPAGPILRTEYLSPVNTTKCFTGEVPQLTNYKDPLRYAQYGFQIKAIMQRVRTGPDAVEAMSQAQALLAEAYSSPLNRRLLNLDDRQVYRAVDPTDQPPYPYGFGGLPSNLTNPAQLKAFLSAPMVVYLTSRDTNVNGGVEQGPACKNNPSLKNNDFTVVQGPYRLARGLSFWSTGRALARTLQTSFGWRPVVCPGVGHNSISDAHCLQLYDALLGKSGSRASQLADAISNPSLPKEYFHPETYPDTLPCSA